MIGWFSARPALVLVLGGLLLTGCPPKQPKPLSDPATQPDGSADSGGSHLPPLTVDPRAPLEERINQAAQLIERGSPQDLDAAIEVLEQAAGEDPTGVARFNLGLAYQRRGELSKAANHYQAVIAIDPGKGSAWAALGSVQELQGDPQGAFRSYETGIRNDPENIDLRVALIDSLRRQGRLDEAITAAQEALKVNAKHLPVYNAFGLVYLDKGNLVLAKFIFQKAVQEIEGAANNAELLTNLGWTYYLEDNKDRAAEELKKALESEPDLVPALVYLSRVYMDDRNYTDTVPLLEKAAKLDPNNADIQLTLGVAYRGVGRLDDAKAAYDKALSLDPSDPSPHFNHGVLLGDYRKDYAGAIAAFSQYIAAGGKERALAETYIKDIERERINAEKKAKAEAERKAREEERKRKEELIRQSENAPPGSPAPGEPAPDQAPEGTPPEEDSPWQQGGDEPAEGEEPAQESP